MSQDKELLLKDLCARLPYGVKIKLGDNPNIFDLEYRIKFAIMYGYSNKLEDILDITNIEPYLFPLSSMTEEQKKELEDTLIKMHLNALSDELNSEDIAAYEIDFYNRHHIDYRGLIEKGLAIDATDKNIY